METLIKTLEVGTLHEMAAFADKPNRVAIMSNENGKIFLLAFKRGESLSEHQAPGDAMVQVIEGSVEFNTKAGNLRVYAGQFFLMAKGEVHSVYAPEDAKMLLTIIHP